MLWQWNMLKRGFIRLFKGSGVEQVEEWSERINQGAWTLRAAGWSSRRQIKFNMKQARCRLRISLFSFLNAPAAAQLLEVSRALTSPCLICFPCIMSASCGNRVFVERHFPWRARAVHVWATPPMRQSIKTQRHKGEDRQWDAGSRPAVGHRALTVTASSAEDVALTHREKQWRPSREDVTKQIKSESSGFLWMKMKMCHTPLYCSSVALTQPTGTGERKLDFWG